eukprot:Gb_29714 [translate_table: standard]
MISSVVWSSMALRVTGCLSVGRGGRLPSASLGFMPILPSKAAVSPKEAGDNSLSLGFGSQCLIRAPLDVPSGVSPHAPIAGGKKEVIIWTLLFHGMIDGLVDHAHKLNLANKLVECDLECFNKLLSTMQFTLQGWLPKFEQAFGNHSSTAKKQTGPSSPPVSSSVPKDENLISLNDYTKKALESSLSPSPLVSWPLGIKNDNEKGLFCLTPMPASRKSRTKSKVFPPSELTKSVDEGELNSMVKSSLSPASQNPSESPPQKEAVTPKIPQSLVSKYSQFFINKVSDSTNEDPPKIMGTPGLEISPPKTCLLLRPMSDSFQQEQSACVQSTPPLTVQFPQIDESPSSEELESQIPKSLRTKYPEFFKRIAQDSVPTKTPVQTSPHFGVSPPKTCVLMIPSSDALSKRQGASESLKQSERDKVSTLTESPGSFSLSFHGTEPMKNGEAVKQENLTQKGLTGKYPNLNKSLLQRERVQSKEEVKKSFGTCVTKITVGVVDNGKDILSDTPRPLNHPVSVLPSFATFESTPTSKIAPKITTNTEKIDRQPGEQTLRRELWSKLEAESADMRYTVTSTFPKARKGFLRKLDDASSSENTCTNVTPQVPSLGRSFSMRKEAISDDGSSTIVRSAARISLYNVQSIQRPFTQERSTKSGDISVLDPMKRLQTLYNILYEYNGQRTLADLVLVILTGVLQCGQCHLHMAFKSFPRRIWQSFSMEMNYLSLSLAFGRTCF